jgi:hypothetical protein
MLSRGLHHCEGIDEQEMVVMIHVIVQPFAYGVETSVLDASGLTFSSV